MTQITTHAALLLNPLASVICAAALSSASPLTASAQTTLLVRVHDAALRPVGQANVAVVLDSASQHRSQGITDDRGIFRAAGVPAGAAHVVVQRIGYARVSRAIQLESGRTDTLRIELQDWTVARRTADSLASVEHERRVAAARARGRHWTCQVPAGERRVQADSAFQRFVRSEYAGMRAIVTSHHMPTDSAAFVHEFMRPLSGAECTRLAAGLDAARGLESDSLQAYHFGDLFYFPHDNPYGGAFAYPNGKIAFAFIIPD